MRKPSGIASNLRQRGARRIRFIASDKVAETFGSLATTCVFYGLRMQQAITTFTLPTHGKRLYEFTDEATRWIGQGSIDTGLLTLFCRHTSASLLINENAAPSVQADLLRWLDRAVPEGQHYAHDAEGPDDMPAHIRAMLTGVTLTVPVKAGRMMLGTWQGLYLAEHRSAPHRREVVAHLLGE